MSTHDEAVNGENSEEIESFENQGAAGGGEPEPAARKPRKPRASRTPKLSRADVESVYAAQASVAAADKKARELAYSVTRSSDDRELVTKILTGTAAASASPLLSIAALIEQPVVDRVFTLIGSERKELLALRDVLDSLSLLPDATKTRDDAALAKAITLALDGVKESSLEVIRGVVALIAP